jgi:putative DNA primase/helicase
MTLAPKVPDANAILLSHGSDGLRDALDRGWANGGPKHMNGDELSTIPPAAPADQQPVEGAEFEEQVDRLAALGIGSYEQERKEAAKRLGVRTKILDHLVATKRGTSADDGKQGRAVELPEPEPWPEPVDGAELLSALSGSVRSHVVMSDHEGRASTSRDCGRTAAARPHSKTLTSRRRS